MKRLKVHMVDLSKANFSKPLTEPLKKILVARGIFDDKGLNHSLSSMPAPSELHGMDSAVKLLVEALKEQKKILILGDYDADGATSTALAVRALREMGAQSVSFLVPNRFDYGYGLSPEISEVAVQMSPDLIITVDNGISSIEGVRLCKEQGIQVLVTDHHLPGGELPNADAILNPNQPECGFPSKHLAGVGVLFYLMVGLRQSLREMNWFLDNQLFEPRLEKYLDLVALGTVADLVPLDRVNRLLVSNGLKLMAKGAGNPGVAALFEVSGRNLFKAKSTDLGFAIGPRINAAGRLDDISEGIRCLLTDDEAEARELALDLHHINLERRQIQSQMIEEAEALVEGILVEQAGDLPWGLSCYKPDWHQGVVGLVASRLKESLHRPAVAFAKANPDDSNCDEIKGSARSIRGVHIRDLLDRIAVKHSDVIKKFGGHAMAAGLSISSNHYEQFAKAFDEEVRGLITEDDLEETLWSDGELAPKDMNIGFAKELEGLLPWGQQLAEPGFHGSFVVEQVRWLKEKHLKLRLSTPDGAMALDAIWFNAKLESEPVVGDQLSLLYRLNINEYRGVESLQLMIIDEVSYKS